MESVSKKVGAIMWMISHYKWSASRCWNLYPDLSDAYFMYDFYMQKANEYEKKLIDIL